MLNSSKLTSYKIDPIALQACTRIKHYQSSAQGFAKRKQSSKSILVARSVQGSLLFDSEDSRETTDRLELVSRQLSIAVSDENYELAQQFRKQQESLMQKLSIPQQQAYERCQLLKNTVSAAEQLKIIRELASSRESIAIPTLAQFLHDENLRNDAESAMWQIWSYHEDPEVDRLMKEGSALLYVKNLESALQKFEQISMKVPSYAEGQNKIATVLYLMKDYKHSIEVCKVVIELEPYHFGALSGMGLCHLYLGENEEALNAFRQAISVNPGLSQISNFILQLQKEVKD